MKLPEIGDTVIDYNRILHQKGVITKGVFDFSDPSQEKAVDVYVSFSMTSHTWYVAEYLQPYWDELHECYIIGSMT